MSLNFLTKLLVLLLLPLLFTAVSCNKPTEPPPPENYALEIIAVDASCTEVWLEVKSPEIELPQSFTLTENGEEKGSVTINKTDTTIVIENLLPKKTYKYQLKNIEHKSNQTEITTLDTTSHNFTWQTFEFGQHSSSVLYDVAIIDENNIWAVGEIYMNDSNGNPDPTFYNAVHWNGTDWELKKIFYKGGIWTIRTIFAFNGNDIWFSGYMRYLNGQFIELTIPNILMGWQINKMWGSNSNGLYAVGNNGNIAHWNGSSWKKIESPIGTSGTDVDFSSITSGLTVNEVFVSGRGLRASALIKLNNQTIEKLWISDELLNYGSSIWGIKNIDKDLFVACSNGLVRKKLFAGDTEKIVANKTPWQTTAITGDKSNNIFRLCVRSEIYHYNGITDKKIYEDHTTSNRLLSGKVKDNLIIGVGTKSINEVHSKARIIMGSK